MTPRRGATTGNGHRDRPRPTGFDLVIGTGLLLSLFCAAQAWNLAGTGPRGPRIIPVPASRVPPPGGTRVLSPLPVAIGHRADGGLFALSLRCPHLGCRVRAEPSGGFRCPCHGDLFAGTGEHLSGPSPSHLDRFRLIRAGGDGLRVDRRVRYRMRGAALEPGRQHPASIVR
ncbi:MAG: ubiquinol-cytochrome c reductase iron-sulfur subunit [Acidobacteriota bacterium]